MISESSHVTLLIHKLIDKMEGNEFGSTGSGISQTVGDKANRRGIQMITFKQDDWTEKITKLYMYYYNNYNWNNLDEFIQNYGTIKINDIEIKSKDDVLRMLEYEISECANYLNELRKIICNTSVYLNNLPPETSVIFEGANSIWLTPELAYPYCTSTDCLASGICSGSGVSMKWLTKRNFKITGVSKCYITRVGEGILMTEDNTETGETLQKIGKEVGVTTGRIRRTGHFDLVLLKRSCTITGVDYLNITKLDVLNVFDKVLVCKSYKNKKTGEIINERTIHESELGDWEPEYVEYDGWKDFNISECKKYDDLHENIKKFIKMIENETGVPVKYVNTGRESGYTIIREDEYNDSNYETKIILKENNI